MSLLKRDPSLSFPGPQEYKTMDLAREEADTVISGCFQDLLDRTGLKPREIDFLVINCSLFTPTPSLCAMVSNKFGLRSDCKTYVSVFLSLCSVVCIACVAAIGVGTRSQDFGGHIAGTTLAAWAARLA